MDKDFLEEIRAVLPICPDHFTLHDVCFAMGGCVNKSRVSLALSQLSVPHEVRVVEQGGGRKTSVYEWIADDREGKDKRLGEVLSPESAQIRDERFIGGSRIRRRGDVSECPERTWITPVSGIGERRLGVQDGRRKGTPIFYKGVTYNSIAAATRALRTTRYAIECGLGRIRK